MEGTYGAFQLPFIPPLQEHWLDGTSVQMELSSRQLWQQRTKQVSCFIGEGNFYPGLAILSLMILSAQFAFHHGKRYWNRSISSDTDNTRRVESYTPLAYALTQMVFAVAAFALSVVATVHQTGSWKRSFLLGYAAILCVLRYAWATGVRGRIYHHVNAVETVATLLSVTQTFLPLTIIDANYSLNPTELALDICLAVTIIIPFIAPSPRRDSGKGHEEDDWTMDEKVSLEETCSLFSYFWSYEWITYLILRGCRRDLVQDDLPPLPSYDAPLKWLSNIRKQRQRGGKTFFMLLRLLRRELRIILSLSAVIPFAEYIALVAMFNLLGYLGDPSTAVVHPILWILLLFLGPALRSLGYQHYIFTTTRVVVRLSMSLVQEIYHTAMRSHIYDSSISGGEGQDGEHGKSRQADITTLMSYDIEAIYNSRDIFFFTVSGSINITIAIIFLYHMVGWPSFIGVAALFLLSPLPAMVSRRVATVQRTVMRATDARLSRITEYLGSIRTLKYFGWEPAMEAKVNALRDIELKRIWRRNILAALITVSGELLPMICLLVTFAVVVLATDMPLEAPKAFTSLSIMEILRVQFTVMSNMLRMASQGIVSLRRMDQFFESMVEIERHPRGPPEFKNATFRRTPIATFRLQGLSIAFREHELNVVSGPTGSGKTSLLLSLIGETILESGTATCPSDVAYVPQTAWLENDTVRQNILFYSAFDQKRYDTVVAACGLLVDLEQLPDGDLTVVGERGTSLSGGQKQRVSLARAIYSHASLLLLDDVFSALDAHTTTLVYDQCFRTGLLSGRTVILVTHLPVALQEASMVVSLEHGKIASVEHAEDIIPSSSRVSTGSSSEDTPVEGSSGLQTPLDLDLVVAKPGPQVNVVGVPAEPQKQSSRLVAEQSAKGRIPRTLMFEYMLSFGGWTYAFLAISLTLIVQVVYFAGPYWLSIWTEIYAHPNAHPNTAYYLSIYAALIVLYLCLQVLNILVFQAGGWNAAKKMHSKLIHAILFAPVSWFDQNPIGRALNRFGNDTRSMDVLLVEYLRATIHGALRLVLRIASIASVMPIFALPAAIVCSIGFVVGEMYTRAQVSIKRLVSVNYSPVFIQFTDTLAGMNVIRARDGMNGMFQKLLAQKIAVHARSTEAQYNSNRWVSIRSDICAATVSAAAGFVAYTQRGSAGLVGFSLSNAVGMSQTILILVRTMNELEIELNSFQRIKEYAAIEPEESETAEKEGRRNQIQLPPAHWPTAGLVRFSNVTARYHGGPNVLRDVSFVARPGQRIGIVGRTGSGKSTLGLSLLRFTELVSGQITIDGVDISTLPVNRLRTSISLIPQEPVLFSGDVQSNLDPFGELDETDLQAALSACTAIQVANDTDPGNGSAETGTSITLNTPVAASGENFSQGQRQILGLARAISRRSKVVLLDEATASVDQRTDEHIQRIIRSEFADSTIIAIAHRLRTIVDYDQVVVMGDGEVLEMGSPSELVGRNGVFCDMLRNTGEYEELLELVKKE